MANSAAKKSYDFKSVGTDIIEDVKEQEYFEIVGIPIGIKTPLELGGSEGIFKMHDNMGDQVKDNFRNLLLTNHGERLGQPDYGANLDELTLELGNEKGDIKAMQRIRTAVQKFMPYISLENFEPFAVEAPSAAASYVGIRVIYSIPLLGVTRTGIELILAGQK